MDEATEADPTRSYFQLIRRPRLLGAAGEIELARSVESSDHALVAALLDIPALTDEITHARAELAAAGVEDEAAGHPVAPPSSRTLADRDLGLLLDEALVLMRRATKAPRPGRPSPR